LSVIGVSSPYIRKKKIHCNKKPLHSSTDYIIAVNTTRLASFIGERAISWSLLQCCRRPKIEKYQIGWF